MGTFSALYFDGVSSGSTVVTVVLNQHQLVIQTEYESEIWQIAEIHPVEFVDKDLLVLKYGSQFPYETIEIKDQELIQVLLTRYGLGKKSKKYNLVLNHGVKGVLIAALILATVILGSYFYVIPSVAETAAGHLPRNLEEKLGEAVYTSFTQFDEIDTYKSEQVTEFYNALGFDSEFDVRITVVDSDTKNAFALPGGHVVVYSGILDDMESPEELAALISHELTHVNQHHSTKSIFRSLGNSLLLSILLNDVNGMTAVLASGANTLQQLSYGRSLEKEADQMGMEMMLQNNINPAGMARLMERLQDAHNHDFDIPEFLHSHPLTENRIEDASAFSAQHKQSFRDLSKLPAWQNLQGNGDFKD